MKRIPLTLLLLLASCASAPEDPAMCTRYRLVPITVVEQVYFVRSHCIAWQLGPSPMQEEAFDRRKNGKAELFEGWP